MTWKLGCGQHVRFWTDSWVPDVGKLYLHTKPAVTIDPIAHVEDFIKEDGGWDWRNLHSLLTTQIYSCISLLPATQEDGSMDTPYWKDRELRRFLVKSTYTLLDLPADDGEDVDSIWNLIWHSKGSERIKYFACLVTHGKLLTNEQGFRRNMATEDACMRCDRCEFLIHALRDCEEIREIWLLFGREMFHAISLI